MTTEQIDEATILAGRLLRHPSLWIFSDIKREDAIDIVARALLACREHIEVLEKDSERLDGYRVLLGDALTALRSVGTGHLTGDAFWNELMRISDATDRIDAARKENKAE